MTLYSRFIVVIIVILKAASFQSALSADFYVGVGAGLNIQINSYNVNPKLVTKNTTATGLLTGLRFQPQVMIGLSFDSKRFYFAFEAFALYNIGSLATGQISFDNTKIFPSGTGDRFYTVGYNVRYSVGARLRPGIRIGKYKIYGILGVMLVNIQNILQYDTAIPANTNRISVGSVNTYGFEVGCGFSMTVKKFLDIRFDLSTVFVPYSSNGNAFYIANSIRPSNSTLEVPLYDLSKPVMINIGVSLIFYPFRDV